MIKDKESISMPEAVEYLDKEKHGETLAFIKNFTKMKPEKAKELRKALEDLDMIKLNREHITKLIEMLPEEKEGLNKALSDAHLDEEEINKI